jgi:hypothetical protein
MAMAKIFISYDRASKDIVEQLIQDLTDDGHEIWFDQHLRGGQKWWDNILSEIRHCEVFVAALTLASLESKACQRELNYARDLQRIMLPVRLSDKVLPGSLPPNLSELQWVDYSDRNIGALKSLQRTLRRLPNVPPLPEPLPEPPPVPISPLHNLRTKITSESLTREDQIQLVFELRSQFEKGENANEIVDLLQRLKSRGDLFVSVLHEVDRLLRQIELGITTPKPPNITRPEHTNEALEGRGQELPRHRKLYANLLYLCVLALTIFGVAYTSMAHQPLVGFWEALAIAVGVLCVITTWPTIADRRGRVQLIWKQALYWTAILVAMNIVLMPGVRGMLTAPATGLTILLLLALGTILAGINASLQIIFLGLAMALAVPAIVWLTQSALFLLLSAVAVIGIGISFVGSRSGGQTSKMPDRLE